MNRYQYLLVVLFIAFVALLWARKEETQTESSNKAVTSTTAVPHTISNETKVAEGSKPEALRRAIDQARHSLPTIVELENAQLHPHPYNLTRGSEFFAEILDTVKEDPSLLPLALDFYKECARQGTVLDALRANCLRYFIDGSQKAGRPVDPTQFPSEIARIARALPRKHF